MKMKIVYEIGNFVVAPRGKWFEVWTKHDEFMGAEKYNYQAIQLAQRLHREFHKEKKAQ